MLTEPIEQTDKEAEMLELSGFCPICSYKMSVHVSSFWTDIPAPDDLKQCPNYERSWPE